MARYRIQFGDREVDLPGGELIVGRGMGCHVRLRAPSVSRKHLRILQVANSVVAYDLESRNGTLVNDEPISTSRELRDGDVVRMGTQCFELRQVGPEEEWEQEPETWETTREKAEQAETTKGADEAEPSKQRRRSTDDWAITRETIVPEEDLDEGNLEGRPPLESTGMAVGEQKCSSCGTLLDVGMTFCPQCGTETYSAPTYRTCPGCRALMSAEDAACPKCGLERPAEPTAPPGPDDRRASVRLETAVKALYVSSSLTFDAEVADISLGGLFMSADLLDPIGTQADLILSTDARGGARFVGEVVRVVDEPDPDRGLKAGMGIKFTGIMPSARRWLDTYLLARTGAPRA